MKCYTITESYVRSSIVVTQTTHPHIEMGEDLLKQVNVLFQIDRQFADKLAEIVPCPKRNKSLWTKSSCPLCEVAGVPEGHHFRHPDEGEIIIYRSIDRCSIQSTNGYSSLCDFGFSRFQLIEEVEDSDNSALVLADISAGYNGTVEWTGTNYEEVPCFNRGTILANTIEGSCPQCGVDCTPVGDKYKHPNAGIITDWARFPAPGITILAQGYKAKDEYSMPNRHVVMMLLMEKGAAFRVKCSGQFHKNPLERFIIWTGKKILVSSRNEIWPQYCSNYTAEPEEKHTDKVVVSLKSDVPIV